MYQAFDYLNTWRDSCLAYLSVVLVLGVQQVRITAVQGNQHHRSTGDLPPQQEQAVFLCRHGAVTVHLKTWGPQSSVRAYTTSTFSVIHT